MAQPILNIAISEIKERLENEKKINISIAFFGQPGSGKSTLINKLLGRNLAKTGVTTDTTNEKSEYEWTGGINLVDLPGYDTIKHPTDSFFQKFNIPSFDLFICVTDGKLHSADVTFFKLLKAKNKVCIFVSSKSDTLWQINVTKEELVSLRIADLKKHIGDNIQVLSVSSLTNDGLDKLQNAILENLEPAKRERWARSACAYSRDFLAEKRKACERLIAYSSAVSAANSFVPPGFDFAVDLVVLVNLFKEIRECYGLNDHLLNNLPTSKLNTFSKYINSMIRNGAEKGIILLLKTFAGEELLKSFAKFIPFVGQAIAASIGFKITSSVGNTYLDGCHELALKLMNENLKESRAA